MNDSQVLRLALPMDDDMYQELIQTTQTKSPAGYIQYHMARRNQDHITDSLRALVMAIYDVLTSDDDFDADELPSPWVSRGDSKWKAPWG